MDIEIPSNITTLTVINDMVIDPEQTHLDQQKKI